MGRAVRSVSLPQELDQIVERNIKEFSEYVQDCIRRDFSDECIKMEIEKHQNKIKDLKSFLKSGKGTKQKKKEESNEEEEFLNWVRKNNSEEYLLERFRVYKMKFGKRISLEKFKELVNDSKTN